MKTYGPEYEAWLATLKVGDTWTAIIPQRFGPGMVVQYTITGETKTRIKCGPIHYYKKNGDMLGPSGKLCPPATEDDLTELRAEAKLIILRDKLSRMRWDEVSLDTLTAIEALLTKEKQP